MTPRTVILAAAHPLFREGLKTVLTAYNLDVVAEAADGDAAIAAAERYHAGVCVMDDDLPGGGVLAVRRLTYRVPDTAVVVLAPTLSADTVLANVRAGANGIVSKSTSALGLTRAVESVLAGQASIPRTSISSLIHEFRGGVGRQRASIDGRALFLTEREIEVLELLRENLTTAQIARQLGLSQVTVRRHLGAIAGKAGEPDRKALLRLVQVA
jgi:DNA-binding NarL/FixJ family response regulator